MSRFADLGGNWGNGAKSGSRYVNTNTATNSNSNNGGRGVCYDLQALCTHHSAVQADHTRWSAWLSSFGKHTTGSGYLRSSLERNADPAFMGKKHKRLFDRIISKDNFHDAYLKTRKGKRKSMGYLEFKEYGALNLERLRQEVADGGYTRAEFRSFYIFDPKLRLISGLPFRDRIVQHALNNTLEPIYLPQFLPYTFACIPGKGTHAGVKYVQSQLRKGRITHFLKTDFSKYFPSVHCPTLYGIHDKKIHCRRTMALMENIQPREDTGVAIGSLKSQLNANLYGTLADDFVHHTLKPIAWARYMDDIVLMDNDSGRLREMKDRLEAFADESMRLRFSKWSIAPISRGIDFLGYRIWPRHKLVRKQSATRAKRTIKALRKRGDQYALDKFLAAWVGHISWADSHNLMAHLEIER